ncbi:MAG: threonine synthase, partial [Eubacteriaceae bacterium]|nr:threonine synthase [Eubacteriaceae bacterium]
MRYYSTRDYSLTASPSEAVSRGLAPDGGLYIPESFPSLGVDEILAMEDCDIAVRILRDYFTDMDPAFLEESVKHAYSSRFEDGDIAPVARAGSVYITELWHGPTCAFKDVALSVLPYLLTEARRVLGMKGEICLLTATSGDTGSAALSGFSDVAGTRIMVFYPHGGVSEMQRRQMSTCRGANTKVCAIRGNFDDAQSAVKSVFLDTERFEGVSLSSANSINIGRLVPQIAYYYTTYRRLVNSGEIVAGEPLSFIVPTGNFGDILAGYFAKKMGLPVGRLICASNENRVLADFFATGTYDRRRELVKTPSPSMDILISSNLERLISLVCGPEKNAQYMAQLSREGIYTLSEKEISDIREDFEGVFASMDEAREALGYYFGEYSYLSDPHTAVALAAYRKGHYSLPTAVLSTASAFKFSSEVLASIGSEPSESEFDSMKKLSAVSGCPIPTGLMNAAVADEVHKDVIDPDSISSYVEGYLKGIQKDKVTVRVSASSANVGPGFDTLAIAMGLYNTFEVSISQEGILEGFEGDFPYDECYFVQAFELACRQCGKTSPKLKVRMESSVPSSRGLGSSATLYIAGIEAANELMGLSLSRADILRMASVLEGHADNAAAAVYGGLTAALIDEDGAATAQQLSLNEKYRFLAFIPDIRISTEESRSILPKNYDRADAVFNVTHLASLIAALQNGDEKMLSLSLRDRIHQPYRLPLITGYDKVKAFCEDNGAAFYLSGSGPTLMAVYTDGLFPEKAREFASTLEGNWRCLTLDVDRQGVTV